MYCLHKWITTVTGTSYTARMYKCHRTTRAQASDHWQVPQAEVLQHVNMKALSVHYTAQQNSWMNRDIFERWFHQHFCPAVKRHLQRMGMPCKATLHIDNRTANPDEDVLSSHNGQIRALFLLPNTTAVLQPLDRGIFETIKHKLLLQPVLAETGGANSSSLLETISLSVWKKLYAWWERPGNKWRQSPS